MLVDELDRFVSRQRFRMEMRMQDPTFFPQTFPPPQVQQFLKDPEIVDETKQRIVWNLLLLNGAIAAISGGLSYVLAGRTLRPIKTMLDEQYRFTSDASHELRTPLTALKTNLEVNLRDKNLTLADAKSLLVQSVSDVDQLQSLTDNLLELSQYEHHSPGKTQKFDVATCIGSVVPKLKPLANKKHITIEVATKPSYIVGSADNISRLLMILIDNAIKYSPENSIIHIVSEVVKSEVVLTVQDFGIGISAAEQHHIFDRFYRADSARGKSDTHGYGLGLSIAKKIVDTHRARIFVRSTLSKGTTFIIKFQKA